MRRLPVRRTLSAALVPLVLVGVTACGDDSKNGSANDGSKIGQPFGSGAKSDATGTAEPAPATEEPTVDLNEGDDVSVEDFSALMKSAIENQGSYNMSMNADAAGTAIKATGSMDATDPNKIKMKMEMDMGTGTMEMVLVEEIMYMKMAGIGGGKWIKMTMSELDGLPGMGDLTTQMDPNQQLENLVPGLKTIVYEGTEKRGDGDAREYTVVVDSTKVEGMSDTPGVPAELTYQLFFDDEDRMVGMDMDMAGTKVDMTMTDFGTGVTVEAPPASEVSDQSFSEMLGGTA